MQIPLPPDPHLTNEMLRLIAAIEERDEQMLEAAIEPIDRPLRERLISGAVRLLRAAWLVSDDADAHLGAKPLIALFELDADLDGGLLTVSGRPDPVNGPGVAVIGERVEEDVSRGSDRHGLERVLRDVGLDLERVKVDHRADRAARVAAAAARARRALCALLLPRASPLARARGPLARARASRQFACGCPQGVCSDRLGYS